MGEGLFDGIGRAIENMPPTLAALVILALAVAGLIYAWRKSGQEAMSEKAKAERAAQDGIHGKLDGIHGKLDGLTGDVATMKTDIAVIKDRGQR